MAESRISEGVEAAGDRPADLQPVGLRFRSGLRTTLGRLSLAVQQEFAGQADRGFLWSVVAFGAGIALFFSWPTDPSVWSGPAITAAGGGAFILRRFRPLLVIGAALMAIGLGHSAAQLRTWTVGAPLLEHKLGVTTVRGRVIEAEKRPEGDHVVISEFTLPGLTPAATPAALRVTIPATQNLPAVGSRIGLRAIIDPVGRPVAPDSFQFQRFLYFDGVGASGFGIGRWFPIAVGPDLGWFDRFHAWTESLRRAVGDRFVSLIPTDDGTVAAALINGEQSAIPQTVQESYRVSGIAHILSVSGVHLSLLAGIVFLAVRRGFALIPAVALRIDTKKAAAWVALAATGFYLVISGMSVPAIRSFLMVATVLLAVLVDRRAISLRNVAWAALILMAIYPDAIVGPSFQMSFLAVLSLVALYEQAWLRVNWRGADGSFNVVRAGLFYFLGLIVTDIVAGGATALFAAYHFNRLPTYSMFTNLVAAPLTSLWIMPTAVVAMLLMPFGWDKWATIAMGYGVKLLDDLAHWVASWKGAQVHIQPMTTPMMAGAALGAIFVCLWKGRLRWLGLIPVATALIQPFLIPVPDLLVDDAARVVAVSDAHGHLVIRPGRGGRFVRDVWTGRFGLSAASWPAAGARDDDLGLVCDPAACTFTRNAKRALIAFKPAAVTAACGQMDVIVTALDAAALCASGRIVDKAALARDGGTAIWLGLDGIRVRTVTDADGRRIWNGAGETPDDAAAMPLTQ